MKTQQDFLQEVEYRLALMFRASKDGHKASPIDRHRLEGFMQAGVFLELAPSDEIQALMERVHFDIFEKTIEQRQKDLTVTWQSETLDYSRFEAPSYERNAK